MKEFKDITPIWAIEHDAILSKCADVTVGFLAELPELFTLSAQDHEAMHVSWIKAMKVLPTGSILHKQDWFVKESYRARYETDMSFLSRASERFFHERPYLDHHCYLFLTLRASDRKFGNSAASLLLRQSIVPVEFQKGISHHRFFDAVGQFEAVLKESGLITLKKMNEAALKTCVHDYLNLEVRARVIRDIEFEERIRVGEKHCELFSLADTNDLPAHCGPRINYDRYSTDKTKFSIGFAAPLGQLLSCDHIYNQYVFIEDAAQTMKRLEAKKRRLQSMSAYSRENLIARDAVDLYLTEAVREQRMPVRAHYNIVAWTDETNQLKEIRNQCAAAITQLEASPKIETAGAPQLFWAAIPGNAADMPINETFETFVQQAVCFFNCETNYRSSTSPIGIRLGDRLTGRPVHVDLSDEPMERGIITNRNKFIIGPSGSGKSFFMNHLVRSYYEKGTHIVVVDVGHSYRGLCNLVKGYYFTYSEENPIRFNPFYLSNDETLDTEKKESIKALLITLWKRSEESYSRSEYVALSNALTGYYAKIARDPDLFPCFDSFYEYMIGEFKQQIKNDNVKDKDFDVSNFVYVLRPYYKGGEFDYLLNAKENLDLLRQPFIVFELDNIKDHPILFPVVTIIIMEVFISKMRKLKGIRKMILIEEAWKAIAREGMAEYIKYLFKTVRKHFGEAIVVTQEVEDIISSPIVKQAIINNSDCKILLDQTKYQNKFDPIQELLGLSEKEKALVLSVNRANDPGAKYKEVFISLGGVLSKVYRTEVSPEEYLTYTTEEKEKKKVEDASLRNGGDTERAIRNLCAE